MTPGARATSSRVRRICVVTGSRAEYGRLYWLLREIAADPALRLQIVATGMHLSPRFGSTVEDIARDGFAIDARVDMELDGDDPASIARSMGLGLAGMTEALGRLGPDVVVLHGDRFEIFAAAQAAMLRRIPIAHINGGELTEGVIDEAMRHAITKMAHLHFAAAEPYARRIEQLGEDPACIFTVGDLGVEWLARLEPLGREDLESFLGLRLGAPLLLVTHHPTTLGDAGPEAEADALLAALDSFPEATMVFTGVNADPGGAALAKRLKAYAAGRSEARYVETLGQRRYLSLLRLAHAVVGNSSSGLIDAPAARVPTVNIGDRQSLNGRLRAASVIDCAAESAAIVAAIRRALDPAFRRGLATMTPPLGGDGVAARIRDVLRDTALDGLVRKGFRDLAAQRRATKGAA